MTDTDLRAEFESWKDSVTIDTSHSFLRGIQAALSGMARRINAISLHLEIREYFDKLIAGERPVAPPTPGYFGSNRPEWQGRPPRT